MSRRLTSREITWIASVAGALGLAVAALHFLTPNVLRPKIVEGQPLLSQDGGPFFDEQTGLRFTPPPKWAMQARSVDSPTNHLPERMLVKYKQFQPGIALAWLRVSVADVANKSPSDLLKAKKPPDPNWKTVKDIEDGLTLGGRPAARITFGGALDPDSKGPRDYSCEIVAVNAGAHVYYFAGTYLTTDKESQQRMRASVESAIFPPK